jgi:hypothetical protein
MGSESGLADQRNKAKQGKSSMTDKVKLAAEMHTDNNAPQAAIPEASLETVAGGADETAIENAMQAYVNSNKTNPANYPAMEALTFPMVVS